MSYVVFFSHVVQSQLLFCGHVYRCRMMFVPMYKEQGSQVWVVCVRVGVYLGGLLEKMDPNNDASFDSTARTGLAYRPRLISVVVCRDPGRPVWVYM